MYLVVAVERREGVDHVDDLLIHAWQHVHVCIMQDLAGALDGCMRGLLRQFFHDLVRGALLFADASVEGQLGAARLPAPAPVGEAAIAVSAGCAVGADVADLSALPVRLLADRPLRVALFRVHSDLGYILPMPMLCHAQSWPGWAVRFIVMQCCEVAMCYDTIIHFCSALLHVLSLAEA